MDRDRLQGSLRVGIAWQDDLHADAFFVRGPQIGQEFRHRCQPFGEVGAAHEPEVALRIGEHALPLRVACLSPGQDANVARPGRRKQGQRNFRLPRCKCQALAGLDGGQLLGQSQVSIGKDLRQRRRVELDGPCWLLAHQAFFDEAAQRFVDAAP